MQENASAAFSFQSGGKIGQRTMACGEPEPASEIERERARLADQLNALKRAICDLAERLHPVSTEPAPEPAESRGVIDKEIAACRSPVGQNLAAAKQHAEDMTRHVLTITSRLCV